MVSRPTYVGGLGFGIKWDLGWMHDTLDYMQLDPVYRKYHHNELTFRRMYAYSENFVLPLSHDEVVHLKRLAPRQDAGRRLAEVREPAAALRLHVGPAGQEAALHGRRVRRSGASGTTTRASTGTCSRTRGTPASSAGCATSTASTPPSRRSTSSTAIRSGFEWIDCHDADHSVVSLRAPRARAEATGSPPSSTSRRCRASATGSASPCPATGSRC